MIENLGIPVFIDRSSYEMHRLGRTEWVKLYGAMMGKEAEAADFFDRQAEVIDEMEDFQNTEKTVAFFFVSTDGTIVVRRTEDYIPSMIELAGGRYVFQDLTGAEATSSSVSLSMEEFYAAAKVRTTLYTMRRSTIRSRVWMNCSQKMSCSQILKQ